MTASERLAQNVVQTRFESLDETDVYRTKMRILDAIGCAIAGANGYGCREMLNLVKQWGGAPESTIINHGGKVPAHNAAMLNSLMTRSFDFEAVQAEGDNKTCPAHISGTTVPVALAMAEREAASGKDLIAALAAGNDLASRLGVASGFDFSLGWDNTGTINTFGAAAIACKLLKMNEKQVFNAFGIALSQVAGSMAGVFDKTMSFKLAISLASRNGIFAAELAKQGYAGVNEPFMGPRGYFALFCRGACNVDDLTRDLGKKYYADCVIKPYSACRATHPSIDCALQIAGSRDVGPEDIEEITVHTTPGTAAGFCGQPFTLGETPQIDCAFSIRYTVATALLKKAVRPEFFTEEHIRDPKIKTITDKISIVGSIPTEKAPMTDVRVKLKSGEVLAGHTDFPKGDFSRTPLTREEIENKYRSNVAFSGTVSVQNSEKVLDMVERLEDIDDVRDIFKMLVKS